MTVPKEKGEIKLQKKKKKNRGSPYGAWAEEDTKKKRFRQGEAVMKAYLYAALLG